MILNDKAILDSINRSDLIKGAVPENVGPSCYELRMGNVYYDLTVNNEPIQVPEGETILIKPGHKVVLITQEELIIPNDILGRVISKGSFFSIGLSPVCTNADPGFEGNMGIVTQNTSDKYIEIPVNEAIAKIDFNKLEHDSNKPYQGQHGFKTEIWPIKTHLQKTHKDLKDAKDNRIESELEEAKMIIPDAIVTILKNIQKSQIINTVGMVLLIIVNIGLLLAVSNSKLDDIMAIVFSLIASLIVIIVSNIFTVKFK